ncbi:MAG: ABC transporter permease [Acetobacteraceae bacterium]|nr:ABC transporter permease [Acetobacteraceae bacterium]
MLGYVARRLIQGALVILGVTAITFFALHLGGDPTYLYVSEHASAADVQAMRAALGFDQPLPLQYARFLAGLLQGDLGASLTYKTGALGVVMGFLPATVELTVAAMLLAVGLAVPLGVLAALRRGTAWDGGVMLLGMLGQSVPSFWMGILLLLVFGLGLAWLPMSGHVPVLLPLLQGDLLTAVRNLPQGVLHLVLPAVTVCFFSLARNARLVRSSMLEALGQDFVRTARAKGLRESDVVIGHALRNAWLPVVTIIGLEFGFLLGGVVVVETIFAWPGVGRLIFNAINQRDIPLVQAAVIVLAIVFVLLNLLVDILYARLDPRVRLA